ncbi:MAG: hypothetical protein ACXVEE_34560 [Polyangiales bacterium]
MSLLRAILFASPILAGSAAIACNSTTPNRPADLLDCEWVASASNCWKPFVATVDNCLGHLEAGTVADGDVGPGLLSDDRMSCVYPDGGPTINGSVRLDQPQEGDASPDDAPRSFVAQLPSGTVCARYEQSPGKNSVTGPGGTLTWTNDGTTLTITCPDGSVFRGANSTLLDCLTPGELPGYAYYNTTSSAFFQLLGMTGPLYSCQVGAADAATDASPEAD